MKLKAHGEANREQDGKHEPAVVQHLTPLKSPRNLGRGAAPVNRRASIATRQDWHRRGVHIGSPRPTCGVTRLGPRPARIPRFVSCSFFQSVSLRGWSSGVSLFMPPGAAAQAAAVRGSHTERNEVDVIFDRRLCSVREGVSGLPRGQGPRGSRFAPHRTSCPAHKLAREEFLRLLV